MVSKKSVKKHAVKSKIKVESKKVQKNVPVLVKLIAILYGLVAIVLLVEGILVATGVVTIINDSMEPWMTYESAQAFYVIIGLIVSGLGVLYGFICRGLWKVQKWARIVVIVFTLLGIFFVLLSIATVSIMGIIQLTVNIFIGIYLSFIKEAKEVFV